MALLHPLRLLFISFVIWFVFFITIPANYLYDGSAAFPITIFVLYLLCFVLGYYSSKRSKQLEEEKQALLNLKSRQLTLLFFLIGSIGVLTKVYAGFFVTGIYTAANIAQIREELFGQEFSSGLFGVVGAILFPFAVIAMLLVWYNYKRYNKLFVVLATLFGLYPMIDTFFLGGRTTMVLLGGTIAFTVLFGLRNNSNYKLTRVSYKGIKLFSYPAFFNKKRIWIPAIAILFLFVNYSVDVISGRLAQFNYDNTLVVWEELHQADINDDYQKWVEKQPKEEQDYAIGIYSLKHYFAHGAFEYIRLVNHLEKKTGYYYGMFEFHVFFKLFRVFGLPIPSFEELNEVSYKPAVYTTFWGPFYIDFGVFGIIVAFFWGRFVRKVYSRACAGHPAYVVFYGYLATIILASFFLNFLLGSSSYYLFGFLATIIIFKVWPSNIRFRFKTIPQ